MNRNFENKLSIVTIFSKLIVCSCSEMDTNHHHNLIMQSALHAEFKSTCKQYVPSVLILLIFWSMAAFSRASLTITSCVLLGKGSIVGCCASAFSAASPVHKIRIHRWS